MSEYHDIKTPEEFLEYLEKQPYHYGYAGKNGKNYHWQDSNFKSDFLQEYYLQSPQQLLLSRLGVCWDLTELAKDWFSRNGFEHKTFFCSFLNELPTHSFLAYKEADNWCWFEYSYFDLRGIHRFNDLQSLLQNFKALHCANIKAKYGASEEDLSNFKICEYTERLYGCGPTEFARQIGQHGKIII